MYKRIISTLLLAAMILLSCTTAYATPPANPHIGSGSNADGGYYFQYLSSSGWDDLNTPPHWVIETGEVAYCVDHKADSPSGNETYSAFDPEAMYSTATYYGLLAILKAGYPYQTGGLSEKRARYATANAIRAWLSESAGIGYNFMNLSRGHVRPKSGEQATYDFMVSLVNKARNNEQPVFSISTNPGNVKLNVQGNKLIGQVTVVFSNINGDYSIDNSKLPNGVTISGCTGNNGDVLTISAPTSYAGQTITLSNIFEAHDTRATSNIYWFEPSGNEQPVLVPITDTIKPVVRGSMTFSSDAFGYIEIIKRDSETGEVPQGNATLNGAIFEICNADGVLMERLECGENDNVTSAQLPLGIYTIKEVQPPTGYLLNETVHTVEIEYSDQNVEVNRQSYIIPDDVIKGRIAITKFADAALAEWNTDNPNPPLQGVEFEIRLKSTGELVDTLVTDTDGKALSIELAYGTYIVAETKTVQGYMGCDSFEVVIDEHGKVYSFIVTNEVYRSKVRIVKVDSDTGETIPIAGTEFLIRDSNGELIVQTVTYPQEKHIDTFITDETGTLTLPEPLIYGDYTLHEIKAPYGYWLNDAPLAFSIDDSGKDLVTVEFANVLIQKRIRIVKTDTRDTERRLAGAVFEVYKGSELVDTMTTNENGYAETKLLTVGEYRVVEVKAPTGFALDNASFDVSIDDSDTMVYTFVCENSPTEVTITKTDVSDNSPLPNAYIEIYDDNGKLVFFGNTDEKGELCIQELPFGKYTFKEKVAPTGYVLNETVFEFEILENGDIIGETTMTNSPTVLEINKVIYESNEPLTGAGFRIKDFLGLNTLHFTKNEDGSYRLDEDGDVTEILVDENGQAVIYGLPVGNYWIEESTVPTGYYPAAPVKITISETNNIDMPYETIIPNSKFVKLGLDRDRYNVPIAIGLTLLAIGGTVFLLIKRKRKERRS